jgi:hypothetical protein
MKPEPLNNVITTRVRVNNQKRAESQDITSPQSPETNKAVSACDVILTGELHLAHSEAKIGKDAGDGASFSVTALTTQ